MVLHPSSSVWHSILPLAILTHFRSAEIPWWFVQNVHSRFSYSSADGRVHYLVEAAILSRKRDAKGVPGSNKLYAAQAAVWVASCTEQCSVGNSMSYTHPHYHVDPEDPDPLRVFLSVPHVYDVHLDAEGGWYLSNALLYDEINMCSSLRAGFTVVRHWCGEYLVRAPIYSVGN